MKYQVRSNRRIGLLALIILALLPIFILIKDRDSEGNRQAATKLNWRVMVTLWLAAKIPARMIDEACVAVSCLSQSPMASCDSAVGHKWVENFIGDTIV